jgi:hypothetical protein
MLRSFAKADTTRNSTQSIRGASLNAMVRSIFRLNRGYESLPNESMRVAPHNRLPDFSPETQARRRVLPKLSNATGAV